MKAEENKNLIRQLKEEVINKKNPAAADRFFSENFVIHNPIPNRKPGREGLKEALAEFFIAFPDIHEDIEELVAEENKVAVLGMIHATHKGEFMGIPATGNKVTVAINEIYNILDGKIQHGWVYIDFMGLMQQISILRSPT